MSRVILLGTGSLVTRPVLVRGQGDGSAPSHWRMPSRTAADLVADGALPEADADGEGEADDGRGGHLEREARELVLLVPAPDAQPP